MERIFDDLEVEEERPDYAGRWPPYRCICCTLPYCCLVLSWYLLWYVVSFFHFGLPFP